MLYRESLTTVNTVNPINMANLSYPQVMAELLIPEETASDAGVGDNVTYSEPSSFPYNVSDGKPVDFPYHMSYNEPGLSSNETLINVLYGESSHEWKLSTLDIAIVVVYLVFSLGLGLWYGCRRQTGTEEYFLAGRSSSWPLVGLSIFASNISSSTLVGLAGDAYAHGIAVYSYEWMAAVVLVVVAVVLLPGMIKAQVFTIPELLHCMYNPCARYYYSALTLLLNVMAENASTLYAGALLLQILVPGWELWHIMAALAGLAGLYTVTGGLGAVMVTDAIQAVLLLGGSIIITVAAVNRAGGWHVMMAAQPQGSMSIVRPLSDHIMPWPGLLGVFILGLFFFATNQFMAQRMLSAGSVREGQWGALFAGALKLPVLFVMVVPGLAARLLYPDLAHPDLVYPTLMFDLLPPGLLGLVLAGFLAALMSALDSTLNAAATLVTMDWVRRMRPNLSSAQLKLVGQGVTVVTMVLAVAWAPQIQRFPSLFQYFQKVFSYTVPPVLACYITGFLWPGAKPHAALLGLLLGTLTGAALFLVNEIFHSIHIHFLYIPPILVGFTTLVLIVGSLVVPGGAREDRIILWSLEQYRAETKILRSNPLWQNYRLHSVLLLIATATIVGIFW